MNHTVSIILNLLIFLLGFIFTGANADAKAEQSGAVWVPPISENFEYDAAGNRQNNALWDFGWDAKNQLVRARTKNHNTSTTPQGYDITNAYDAEGRRFSKKIKCYQNGSAVEQKVITFLHDGDDIIYEREQYPSGLTTYERKYVWGPDISGTHGGAGGAGGLLLIRETKGNTTIDLYPLYDGTGHVIGLSTMIGGTATLVAEYAYGPFGEPLYARGPHAQSCPFRFQTKYLDQETGLYNFGKRFLDPITGQWLSREPLGESESANLFSYTHNDPINHVDKLGLASVAVDGSLTTSSFGINALLGFSSNINAFDLDWWEKASETERQMWVYLAQDMETAKIDEAVRNLVEYKAQFTPMAVSSAFSSARMLADPESYIFYRNSIELEDSENPLANIMPARHDGGFIPYLDSAYDFGGEAAVRRAAAPMSVLRSASNLSVQMSPVGTLLTLGDAKSQFSGGHYWAGTGLLALATLDFIIPGEQRIPGKYTVGAYDEIKGTVAGLDAHHVGQKAVMGKLVPGYDPATAPAILVPKIGHTRRGPTGRVSTSTGGITNPRDVIARDIWEMRRVYPDVPNSRLQQLIEMNKDMYPILIK